jgi:hypothetical protein
MMMSAAGKQVHITAESCRIGEMREKRREE